MNLLEIFVNDSDQLEQSLNIVRRGGIPEKFDINHLKQLGFEVTNAMLYNNLFISIGLVDTTGNPTNDYERFVRSDKDARKVIREKIWIGYKDVFAADTRAHQKEMDQIIEIFQKVQGGSKSQIMVRLHALTFKALTDYAEWSPDSDHSEGMEKPRKSSDEALKHDSSNEPSITIGPGRESAHHPENRSKHSSHEYSTAASENSDHVKSTNGTAGSGQFHEYESGSDHNSKVSDHAADSNPESAPTNTEHAAKPMTTNGKAFDEVDRFNDEVDRFNDETDRNGDDEWGNDTLLKAMLKKADLLQKLNRDEDTVKALDEILKYYGESGWPERKKMLPKILIRKAEILEKNHQYDQALSAYEEFIYEEYNQKCGELVSTNDMAAGTPSSR